MNLEDLKPNPKNPRKITHNKLKALKKSLEEFGDLGGIVFNWRTGRLIGGHQRAAVFDKGKLILEESIPLNGDRSKGYILFGDHQFSFREVDWPEDKEMAANIAANKGAGDWDHNKLTEMLHDLDAMNFDLGLTMHSESEIESLFGLKEDKKRDKDSSGKRRQIVCPECDCQFEI